MEIRKTVRSHWGHCKPGNKIKVVFMRKKMGQGDLMMFGMEEEG